MTAATMATGEDADPDWEYAPLRIPAEVTGNSAAAQLALRAEFEGWELARVQRYTDGTRRVWLRRRRREAAGLLPLPGPVC
jgi:hypothetical protein